MPTSLWLPPWTEEDITGVRREMSERGFSLLETPPFVEDDLLRHFKRSRTLLPGDSKRWWRFPQLAHYACWLEELLGQALPEEAVSLVALEFRREPAGSEDREVDRLHADGSYLRTVYTPFGQSTLYRQEGVEHSVPCGQTLLLTALERARVRHIPCTLHRRPGPGPERAVIVCSFEPRPQGPEPAHVYRRVALEQGPRGGG